MSVLKNKSFKDENKYSRYTPFPYYYHTKDKKYVYGTTNYLDDTTPYVSHTVVHGDTYDSLALYYYNNPTLYWIIASFNRVEDCLEDPIEGTTIRIPSISNIKFLG